MNILIVEDDPMVGQINRRFASKLPFVGDISVVHNPDAAKEILCERNFDLLLLDVYFPNGRGPDLLQWIRNKNIPLSVIFITADNSQCTVERALQLGAMDYLVKPFTFARFREALEDANIRIRVISKEDGGYNQDHLDQIFQKSSGRLEHPEMELDKGMSHKTYETVYKGVQEMSASFTAEEIGERLGIARVTIRRYLDFMEKQKILDVNLEYGKIGRPQHHYIFRGKQ